MPQPFSPSDTHPQTASPPTITTQEEHQQQLSPIAATDSLAVSRPQAAATIKPLHLPTIGPFKDHCCKIYTSFSEPPKSGKNN